MRFVALLSPAALVDQPLLESSEHCFDYLWTMILMMRGHGSDEAGTVDYLNFAHHNQ